MEYGPKKHVFIFETSRSRNPLQFVSESDEIKYTRLHGLSAPSLRLTLRVTICICAISGREEIHEERKRSFLLEKWQASFVFTFKGDLDRWCDRIRM